MQPQPDQHPLNPPSRLLSEVMAQAQDLAFGPVNFMTALCLRRMGIFQALYDALGEGMTPAQLSAACDLSAYAVDVLLESGLAIQALRAGDGRYHLSKLGHVLHRDPMTQANMDFVHQVCYRGLFHLEEALREGRPAGLATISPAATVYEGLSRLAPEVQEAWLRFDHFYSDGAFTQALPYILPPGTETLMDIGGNTGRFAQRCLNYAPQLRVTIADLPQQLEMAQLFLDQQGLLPRMGFHACNLLDSEAQLPPGFAAITMSQFLVCFDQPTILRLLSKARASLQDGGRLHILDTFWDRQKDPISAFCLMQTSPYFTTIANGCSKIYRSDTILQLAAEAGLKWQRTIDDLGVSHSLMTFTKQ